MHCIFWSQGPCGTHGNTGTTEGTVGMLQCRIVEGERTGFETSEVVVDGARKYQFMVGPDALSAKDTLAQVPGKKGVCVFKGFIIRHRVKIGLSQTQLGRNLSQLAAVALVANNAGLRVFGNHQTNNIPSMPYDSR